MYRNQIILYLYDNRFCGSNYEWLDCGWNYEGPDYVQDECVGLDFDAEEHSVD